MIKAIIYTANTIPNRQGMHKGNCFFVDFCLLLKITYWVSVNDLLHILFSTSTFSYQNSYFHFYVYIVSINSINHSIHLQLFEYIIYIVNTIPNYSGIQKGKWIMFLIFLWSQWTYCNSVDFFTLVNCFLSYTNQ